MFGENYVNIRGQHLKKFSTNMGGGMDGGHFSESIAPCDDTHAMIKTEYAECHNSDLEIKEYLVDIAVLSEIEAVVRKYRMNFWNRKTFTKMFICDGESKGYTFKFDQSEIYFSSQFYPRPYGDRLGVIKEIIKKYIGSAETVNEYTKKAE